LTPGTYYILILGDNGVYNRTSPYALDIQVTPLSLQMCAWTAPNPSITAQFPVYTGTQATPPETLIVSNFERLAAVYGYTQTLNLWTNLNLLADQPQVKGVVYPVETEPAVVGAYETWNSDYCNPASANLPVEAIWQTIVLPYLEAYPSIKSVVIVGNDEIVPFRRILDETTIANERTYEGDARLNLSALRAALAGGFILSDDIYGDRDPLYWRNRAFALPDVAVGRLIETPGEIEGVVQNFIATGGVITVTNATVTGYDFLTDSAEHISNTLASLGLPMTPLIGETWNNADLRNVWTQKTPQSDLASINAHFAHFEAYPALTTSPPFLNTDVVNATFVNILAFSMGCHSGFNVVDRDVQPSASATSPDFPQAMAQRQSLWFANTGYGYGMDDSIAFSERLMALFAETLTDPTVKTVGDAWRLAKQRYIGTLPSGGFGLYDEKSLAEATLYGLPMTRLVFNTKTTTADVEAASSPVSFAPATRVPQSPTGLQVLTATITPTLQAHEAFSGTTSLGTYFSADGMVQSSPGLPVQPLIATPLAQAEGEPHGIVLIEAEYTTFKNFDPYVTRPVTDVALPEPAFDVPGWYPDKPFYVNRFGDRDYLTFVAGQYNAETESERLYTYAQTQVFYSTSDDWTPPAIWQVEAVQFQNTVTFAVDAYDPDNETTPLYRVYVTYLDADGVWRSLPLSYDDASGLWVGTLPVDQSSVSFFVQAVDQAGNVTANTRKGVFLQPTTYAIYLPLVIR
ncbi:MAG: hypothetical protein D6802_03830, partial [Ardenticatenia bacterium]